MKWFFFANINKVSFDILNYIVGRTRTRRFATTGQIWGRTKPDEALSTTCPLRKVAQVLAVHGQTVVLRQVVGRFRIQIFGSKRRRNSEATRTLWYHWTHLKDCGRTSSTIITRTVGVSKWNSLKVFQVSTKNSTIFEHLWLTGKGYNKIGCKNYSNQS
jgi:hypothetical protein